MESNNIITIGTALKWRGIYDKEKTYYQENIIADGSCIFRCKVSQTQGQPPIRYTDESGHFEFINQDIWDVILDMAAHYNKVADIEHYAKETEDYAKQFEEALENIGTFAKVPVKLKDEEAHEALVAANGILPDQIYYTTED